MSGSGSAGSDRSADRLTGVVRVLIPALMFQSVAIGGAYATGREIIEFGARYGALGWGAGAAMAVTGSVLGFLVYETARRFRLYDYHAMMRYLIGRWFWLFDAIYLPLAIGFIAVMSSATGNILFYTLGVPYWVGVAVIITVTGMVVCYGTGVVERFNSFATILLIAGYVLFAVLTIGRHWDHLVAVFSAFDHSMKPQATLLDPMLLGMIYACLGFMVYPSTLMTIRHLRTRREAAVSAVLTGCLYVLPWFLTYFALIGFYPSSSVYDVPIPWLVMLQGDGRWMIAVYGVLVGWTLVASAIGLIQSVLQRVDRNLIEATGEPLETRPRVVITTVALLVSAALSGVGIVDLIAVGYRAAAVSLIVVFGIPLAAKGMRCFTPTTGSEPALSELPNS